MVFVTGFFIALSTAIIIWVIAFLTSIYFFDKLPSKAAFDRQIEVSLTSLDHLLAEIPPRPPPLSPIRATAGRTESYAPRTGCKGQRDLTPGRKVFAHLSYWNTWGHDSLAGHCGSVDVLLPEWYEIRPEDLELVALNRGFEHQQVVTDLIDEAGERMQVYPVASFAASAGWSPGQEADPGMLQRLADNLAEVALTAGHAGICLAPGGAGGLSAAETAIVFERLHAVLSPARVTTCLVSGAEDSHWRDRAITDRADVVVLLAFRDPLASLPPTPLAPVDWFEALVDEATRIVDKAKLVVSLGNFAGAWSPGMLTPETLGFAEVMRRTGKFGGQVGFHEAYQNSFVFLAPPDGRQQAIWVLDAVSASSEFDILTRRGLSSVGLWSLGYEDPTVWRLLAPTGGMRAERLSGEIALDSYVGFEGSGVFRMVTHRASPGYRTVSLDAATGRVVAQRYDPIPAPVTVLRYGSVPDDALVLTFDDGPTEKYTEEILDILREEGVPATFFVVGTGASKNRALIRRMLSEGHEIGSHTFFHPQISEISAVRTQMEMNALQRLLIDISGHGTTIFRAPYGLGEGPILGHEVEALGSIERLGYAIVGEDIAPPDWRQLSSEQLYTMTREALARGEGNVIALHDGGGDRTATVGAVRSLVTNLRADGYRFVPLAAVAGATRADLMPPSNSPLAPFDAISFGAIALVGMAEASILWLVIGAALLRWLVILLLAHRGRPVVPDPSFYRPRATVVVPAYNEEKVILECIHAALKSDYPDLNLLVVDDGSTDRTFDMVTERYGADPRVRILRQRNGGKWSALNAAYAHLDCEIVISIDADTRIAPDAVDYLVRRFGDPRVGAVAGNIKVGNREGMLTRLQGLEYVTAQNIDRRAFETFNGINVVPGAIGSWRVSAVRAAGLYSPETVTEDADMTIAILRVGYRVAFEPRAIAHTEAPATVHDFLSQRVRWITGMMQSSWKHARAAAQGLPVGLISIPDLWIFGILLALLAPLVDMLFLLALWSLVASLFQPAAPPGAAGLPAWVVMGYLMLPLADVLKAMLAIRFEHGESYRQLLLVPLQRFIYRPLIYVAVYRAVWSAACGRLAAWEKLNRIGLTFPIERSRAGPLG